MILDVARFRQLSAEQIAEMHFWNLQSATPLDRTLKRLTTSRHLARLERPRGGVGGGSAQFVYQLGRAGWKLTNKQGDYWAPRAANLHALAVADCFVRLNQTARTGAFEVLDFQPEPAAHVKVGTIQLTPDAVMRLGFGQRGSGDELAYWLEVDRGTEHADTIQDKCVRYWRAYQQWNPAEVYPLVLFVVPDAQRAQMIEQVIKGGPEEARQLFKVCTFDEFTTSLMEV
ncbi:replication-relaxation family protein [Frankia sp. Cj3]|uniref:replication-relaxation family protein n=1 Tax=Frankia sp. Cj3 TaxID=2880976 RepID=UPI001EF45985|nr:replication-relaxation family protein [Frankia sp. Cj3]